VRRLSVVCATTLVLATLCASCSRAPTASSGRAVGAGVTIAGSRLPTHVRAVVSTTRAPAVAGNLRVLSRVFELTPAGALPAPARVTVPLRSPVPADEAVVVASKETPTGRWTYLPAELPLTRRSSVWIVIREEAHPTQTLGEPVTNEPLQGRGHIHAAIRSVCRSCPKHLGSSGCATQPGRPAWTFTTIHSAYGGADGWPRSLIHNEELGSAQARRSTVCRVPRQHYPSDIDTLLPVGTPSLLLTAQKDAVGHTNWLMPPL